LHIQTNVPKKHKKVRQKMFWSRFVTAIALFWVVAKRRIRITQSSLQQCFDLLEHV